MWCPESFEEYIDGQDSAYTAFEPRPVGLNKTKSLPSTSKSTSETATETQSKPDNNETIKKKLPAILSMSIKCKWRLRLKIIFNTCHFSSIKKRWDFICVVSAVSYKEDRQQAH